MQGYALETIGIDIKHTNIVEWENFKKYYNYLCIDIINQAVTKYPEAFDDFLIELGGYGIDGGELEAIPQCLAKYYTTGSENAIIKEIAKEVEGLK